MPEASSPTAPASTYLRYEWEIQDEYLIRVHSRPRTALFIQSGSQDIPKLPEELTGLRIPRYQCPRTSEVHEAQYDFTCPTSRLELCTHWTGETWFKLHPSQTR